ncbi:MAG: eL32 family ribosomal protein [Candidatus Korarchaeota archaeon]|nr:eL32 family ribosomal protein [Candidatus Korarchaeota archaeon]
MTESRVEENRILLQRLKKGKPRFLNLARYWRLGAVKSWRKPRGIDNKQRLKLKSRPKQPVIGYKNPDEIRGLHPSGRKPVIVHNVKELRSVAEEYGNEAVIYIAGTVGGRKRAAIREEARRLGLTLAN